MTDSPSSVLVVGATGTVGSEVVRACLARDLDVRALVRREAQASSLPAGVAPVVGDLTSESDIERALADVEAAFYVSPHIHEEEEAARTFTAACRERRLRMVFLGSHIDAPWRPVRWLLRTLMGATLMKPYKAKFRLSEAVRMSGADAVLLAPTNFFQNDELDVVRRGLLEERVYRYPVGGKGMNRVDARDIGEAAARALVDRSIEPGAYPVAGPVSMTGDECAAAWGAVLGDDVSYVEDGEIWERGLVDELDGKKLEDVRDTWRALAKLGVPTMAKHVAKTTELLGRAPTDYAAYVERTAAAWKTATRERHAG